MRGISACLLGVACRYDARALPCDEAILQVAREGLVPFCPEQLGGLPTPRPKAQLVGGDGADVLDGRARVVNDRGADVTEAFLAGAHEALGLCTRLGIREVLLKSHSPSCGAGTIYCGAELAAGDGVTAALLRRQGLRVRVYPE